MFCHVHWRILAELSEQDVYDQIDFWEFISSTKSGGELPKIEVGIFSVNFIWCIAEALLLRSSRQNRELKENWPHAVDRNEQIKIRKDYWKKQSAVGR